ncbi:hypothetical protein PEC18_29605 [Paucibacter sp. O1-1]|nr:hypothetical protein [Paucibacter sp. O1-1]MDA3829897.1 hypothetical protein [Paucibacter sp. O1-1]
MTEKLDGKYDLRPYMLWVISNRLDDARRAVVIANLTTAATHSRSVKALNDIGLAMLGWSAPATNHRTDLMSVQKRFLVSRAATAHLWQKMVPAGRDRVSSAPVDVAETMGRWQWPTMLQLSEPTADPLVSTPPATNSSAASAGSV